MVTALVRSFHDSELQQYVAFTTAVEQLIGAVDWVIDPENNRIKYITDVVPQNPDDPSVPYQYSLDFSYGVWATPDSVCSGWNDLGLNNSWAGKYIYAQGGLWGLCSGEITGSWAIGRRVNPYCDPDAPTDEEKYLPLDVVAQQVISNADSSADGVLKLLSEDYINLVANSVFDSNPSKQFVKLEDLLPQLEANKVLR